MIDRDGNPRTYTYDPKIKGYDKKALWSARVSPDQERLEDPCVMTGDVADLSGYTSCTIVVTPDTESVKPAARLLQAVEGSTQVVTVGTTINVNSIPECVAVFSESCCFSTNSCTTTPILVAGPVTFVDATCDNQLIMEEICGDDFAITVNATGLFVSLASVASLLAVLTL